MTKDVHSYPFFSMTYTPLGKTYAHNPSRIIVVLFPESATLSTRDQPRPMLPKEMAAR